MIQKISRDLLRQIDDMTEQRKDTILKSPTSVVVTGTSYYVSSRDGQDDADGTSPKTAWATLDRVNRAELHPGDAVFFRRDDLFRGVLTAQSGVTYSAYGNGAKPQLSASPYNGAKYGKWIQTDVPDIYVYSEKLYDDVGCLIFDSGRAYGLKATVDFNTMTNRTDNQPFSSWRDLRDDLSFYHDLGGPNIRGTEENSRLYLKSTRGNPSTRFFSIEFNIRVSGIQIRGDNIRINNLCVKYCGCHGIGAGTTAGLHVDWCAFEWIGGSMQFYRDGKPTRFGNAVEIYGGCCDYTVENCYVNQAYDAGLTHQFSSGGENEISMCDVTYKGNLIENCIYSIEYFCGKPSNAASRHMHHVRISDNIMRFSGYGFGKQRPDKTPDVHIKSWDHFNSADDMIYENNIFDCGAHHLLHIACENEEWMPVIRGNLFIQNEGGLFARLGTIPTASLPYTDEGIASQKWADDSNLFYVN